MADPREGPGGPGPLIIFRPNRNFFWGDRLPPPPSKGLDDLDPPLISRSGSGIVIYHPNSNKTSPMLSLFAVMAGAEAEGHKLEQILFLKVH